MASSRTLHASCREANTATQSTTTSAVTAKTRRQSNANRTERSARDASLLAGATATAAEFR